MAPMTAAARRAAGPAETDNGKAPKKRRKAKKNPGGRPTVITPDVVQKLEEAFKIDATDEEACAYANISGSTFYDHMKKNKPFSERIRAAQRYPFLIMKKVVVKAANEGDGKLAMKWLQNRQRDRYHERVDQQLTVPPKDGAAELAEALLGGDEAPPKEPDKAESED